jgi:hypothetical protein
MEKPDAGFRRQHASEKLEGRCPMSVGSEKQAEAF